MVLRTTCGSVLTYLGGVQETTSGARVHTQVSHMQGQSFNSAHPPAEESSTHPGNSGSVPSTQAPLTRARNNPYSRLIWLTTCTCMCTHTTHILHTQHRQSPKHMYISCSSLLHLRMIGCSMLAWKLYPPVLQLHNWKAPGFIYSDYCQVTFQFIFTF